MIKDVINLYLKIRNPNYRHSYIRWDHVTLDSFYFTIIKQKKHVEYVWSTPVCPYIQLTIALDIAKLKIILQIPWYLSKTNITADTLLLQSTEMRDFPPVWQLIR